MTRRRFLNSKHDSQNGDYFNYQEEGVLMKESVSPALYKNDNNAGFLDILSNLVLHWINSAKNIKRWFIISIDPDDDNFE